MDNQEEENTELQVLVVGKTPSDASKLTLAYGETFMFTEYDFKKTLHKAIQKCVSNNYDICFISDCFPLEEVKSFFSDYEKLEKHHHCAMVQYRTKLDSDFDRDSLKADGFMAIVSLQGSHLDKEVLAAAMKCDMHELEVRKRKIDVKGALDLALKELDTLARERKRGRNRTFNTISVDFINLNTEFDEQILDKYFAELESKTVAAAPEKADMVKIPEAILSKNLPHLDESGYEGASHRVWQKLLKRYGFDSREAYQQAKAKADASESTSPATGLGSAEEDSNAEAEPQLDLSALSESEDSDDESQPLNGD